MRVAEHRYLTPEQYLALEAQSPLKHEYVAGDIYAMTGGSQRHNVITGNVYLALRQHLRGRPCQVFVGDVKLRVGRANAYYYPDVMVACRANLEEAIAGAGQVLEDPVLVIEVLSPGTESTDRREKLAAYRQLPSLQEYVLLSQERHQAEIYRRQGEVGWLYVSYEPGDSVEFASVGLTVALAAFYDGTDAAA